MKPRNLTMPFAAVAMIGLTVAVLIRSPYPVVFLRGAGQTGVAGCKHRMVGPAGLAISRTWD
jgi:hypothetical protein